MIATPGRSFEISFYFFMVTWSVVSKYFLHKTMWGTVVLKLIVLLGRLSYWKEELAKGSIYCVYIFSFHIILFYTELCLIVFSSQVSKCM